MNQLAQKIFLIIATLLLTACVSAAQTTAFTYQGRLTDGGSAANGIFDMQFKLFDDSSAGTQVGPTITNSSVSVAGGVFTVSLDFANAFPGANRFLEISVRHN